MTRERLESFSLDILYSIAEREGIDFDDTDDKNSLIDTIIEAIEEDRQEREKDNNLIMRVKEKKFDLSHDEELIARLEEEYPLPEEYNETNIHLIIRDPYWAFAYWDIRDKELDLLRRWFPHYRIVLRVRKSGDPEFRKCEGCCFDIPVSDEDRRWYVNLPDAGLYYQVFLVVRNKKDEKVLCQSNVIHSPVTDVVDKKKLENEDEKDLLYLSGLYAFDLNIPNEGISQRIITLLDAEYLQLKG